VNYGNDTSPVVDTVFNTDCAPGCTVLTCSCTRAIPIVYWSSTSFPLYPGTAWWVDFAGGAAGIDAKDPIFSQLPFFGVRAVRGGL
jgi:hypothetical protein